MKLIHQKIALLENLQREDLNAIEETEGILQLLAMKLNSTSSSVIALLGATAHPERASVDNVIHSSERPRTQNAHLWITLSTARSGK